MLRDALSNLRHNDEVAQALASLGVDLAVIEEIEPDAALGNGGLGRLAACFMESLASLDLPAYGYGIRYVNGMFRQRLDDGWQVELPETWLAHGNPWEFERRESAYFVGFGGEVTTLADGRSHWSPAEAVEAVAFDTPMVGWRGKRVNTLRLWNARAFDPIKLDQFNAGDFEGALAGQLRAETLTRVLYPNDSTPAGQELRLRQEYFFSSASIQDIVRRHVQYFGDIRTLPDKAAIQLNDTHPAVSVAELMRLLKDFHGLTFDEAWDITRKTFGYTNHTLLPEALESWPLPLFERLLPRHMQLVYAINAKLLREARESGADDRAIAAISLIDEGGERRVRMANLAFAGSHSVNGVAALHTDLMKKTVFADLHRLYPDRINNKTNGITPRRWLQQCNPGLTDLIESAIGDGFRDDAQALTALAPFADDAGFRDRFAAVKRANKVALSQYLHDTMELKLDPDAIFDVQIKRIHEYKRQLLGIVETVALYDQIRSTRARLDAARQAVRRQGGVELPQRQADHQIGERRRQADQRRSRGRRSVEGRLRPQLQRQPCGTYHPGGRPVRTDFDRGHGGIGHRQHEVRAQRRADDRHARRREYRDPRPCRREQHLHLRPDRREVADKRASGYRGTDAIGASRELAQAVNAIASGVFSPDDPNRYGGLMDGIRDHDWFMLAADFDGYAAAQRMVDARWSDPAAWGRSAVLNVANMGWFSSDRTIGEYARDIWNVM